RSSQPVQKPATTAARSHTPPRKHAKHQSKALPLKERVQGPVARWPGGGSDGGTWTAPRQHTIRKQRRQRLLWEARTDHPPPDRVIAAHNKQSSTTGMKACRHQLPTTP
ncbi:Hypothetical predicted protein, partial [Pelobates cultripes]